MPNTTIQDQVEEEQARDIGDYLKTGRAHARLATASLQARWLIQFKEITGGNTDHDAERYDIEADLALRGEQVPIDVAPSELRTLLNAAEALYQRHRRNPRLTAEQAALLAAFESFRREFEHEILALLTLPL